MGSDRRVMASTGADKREFSEKYTMYIVRKCDYDNYWNTIVVREPLARRLLFAVKAFNVEVSQIRDRTAQDNLAVIRLQFWEDAINSIFSTDRTFSSDEPVLQEIKKCNDVLNLKLSKGWFLKMIEARKSSFGLSNFPFNTITEFESYCDSTHGAANYVINEGLVGLNKEENPNKITLKLDHIGNHIGKSQGYANLVRGVIHNASHGRCYIPSELLTKHKVAHQDFLRAKNADKIRDVCYDIASMSHQHLKTGQKLANDPSVKHYYPVFLPFISLERFLNRLRKNNFDILNPSWGRKDALLPLHLLFKSKLWQLRLRF